MHLLRFLGESRRMCAAYGAVHKLCRLKGGGVEKCQFYLKFIYSEKATNFCKISTIDLTVTTYDKSTVEISQKFVAFSEYMNFTRMYFIVLT